MAQIETDWLLINPWKRGHLYFAEKGTFLLCLDREFIAKQSCRIESDIVSLKTQ
jgi:hypothetical protein